MLVRDIGMCQEIERERRGREERKRGEEERSSEEVPTQMRGRPRFEWTPPGGCG
jgi:hypothetical protein